MGHFSSTLERFILGSFFNIERHTSRILYVGLSSSAIARNGSGVSEPPASKGYARIKTFNADSTSWAISDATGTSICNFSDLSFPTPSAGWGTLTHFVVFSGGTAGASVLAYGALTTPKNVDTGAMPRFAAGELEFCLK